MQTTPNDEISLTIRCLYDLEREAVGIDAMPSSAFERADQPRAMVEILAAINAKSNALATIVIQSYTDDADRRRELFDHFAGLKEHMLNDLLEQMD
jgi:hypothetical protein